MTSLGQKLREAREARKISIEEIASSTKIVPRYIEALEADRFDLMPGGFFVKAMIRVYARAVGLNEEEVVAQYRAAGIIAEPKYGLAASRPQAKPDPKAEGTPAPKVVRAAPEPPSEPDGPASPDTGAPTGAGQSPMSTVPTVEAEPGPRFTGEDEEPPERAPLGARLGELVTAKKAVLLAAGTTLVVLGALWLIVLRPSGRPEPSGTSAVQPPPPSEPTVAAVQDQPTVELPPPAEDVWRGVTIEITFQAETWIQVYTDGVLKIDGLFPAGAKAKAEASERLVIDVGNAGGFTFLLNGRPAKPLGRLGQVRSGITITPENLKEFLQEEPSSGTTG